MQNPKRQQGLTFITILIILALIAFFALLTIKIAPIYINHGRVTNAMGAVKEEFKEKIQNRAYFTSKDVLSSFQKRFNVNYVEHVAYDDISITKQGNYLKVEIDYEVVEPLCCHLSALAQFHEQFEEGEK
ncbi:MAG: DUF4845 domain-containing protein [Gammaproteobacteria bacterium]